MLRSISFTLNGRAVRPTVDDDRALLWVLRSDLGLTGTKFGCGSALCGACTVLVDNEAVRSCATRVADVAGKQVLTIEGLTRNGRLHPVQEAFVAHNAFQCGFCTPGMILGAYALLRTNPAPTRADIAEHLDGNLCRCGSHVRVVQAIQTAAEAMAITTRGGVR
jgi:aerobic-type carbon monoxide dehydrogenase small subunit (CoxS/CutS family)